MTSFYKMARPAHGLFKRIPQGIWDQDAFEFEAYYDLAKSEKNIGQDLELIKKDGQFVSGLYTQIIHSSGARLIKSL